MQHTFRKLHRHLEKSRDTSWSSNPLTKKRGFNHIGKIAGWALTKAFLGNIAFQILVGFILLSGNAYCTSYYVSQSSGSDSYAGTSTSQPWQTLSKVMSTAFAPGDVIYLKSGDVWDSNRGDGTLVINRSGNQTSPISYKAYGTGTKPTIRNSGGGQYGSAIYITGSWVTVDGILTQNAGYGGVFVTSSANHTTISNCEATAVGIGIIVSGQYNLITHNYIHDLHMVVNTSGGNDDYGAVGVWIYNSYNEVSYNKLENCYAPSYDYGEDGGGIELYSQGTITGCSFHNNWLYNTLGFTEFGGSSGSISNISIYYNIYVNTHSTENIFYFHNGGTFSVAISNVKIENNTFVNIAPSGSGWRLIGFYATPDSTQVTHLANNIFYLSNWQYVMTNGNAVPYDHNLYYNTGGSTNFGMPLGTADKIGNPLFVDVSLPDLHLLSGSPAVNSGANLGYTLDYSDNPVPSGAAPDIGALEYNAGSTLLPPANLRVVP